MKQHWKIVGIGSAAALLAATMPTTAQAGGRDIHSREAGAIIAGIAAVGVIAAIASSHHSDVQFSYNYSPEPPRCAPPPRQSWVPGHYEIERQQVRIPGHWEVVVEPAVYGHTWHCGRRVRTLIKPACTRRVRLPDRWEWQETRAWVPGHWETSQSHARVY